MDSYPIKLTYHTRAYIFRERLMIPEIIGMTDVPEGVVAETLEISDYRDAQVTLSTLCPGI